MRRPMLFLLLALAAGCTGAKEMFSAHANVAAEAADATLSADSLAQLMLRAKGARLAPETAEFLANLWVDYQLFGHALATDGIPTDSAAVRDMMWPEITELIGTRWHDTLMARRTSFSAQAVDSVYASTDSTAVRVLQHVLVRVDPRGTSDVRDAARRKAEGILARARGGADFGALARQYTDDQASRQTGGVMNAAPRGAYVTPFDSAGWSLAPGQVSGLVVSPFGFHIIRRPPLAEVRTQLLAWLNNEAGRRLDSLYMDSLAAARHLAVKSSAPATLRTAVEEFDEHRGSTTALATYDGGKFTVGEALKWTGSAPPALVSQIQTATDSQLTSFVRALAQNTLLLDDARTNGIDLSAAEYLSLRESYLAGLDTLRYTMGLTRQVIDTTATADVRERAAALQVGVYLDKVLKREAPPRPIPGPMAAYLRERYVHRIEMAGVRASVERALAERDAAGAADSAARATPVRPQAPPQVGPQGGGRP